MKQRVICLFILLFAALLLPEPAFAAETYTDGSVMDAAQDSVTVTGSAIHVSHLTVRASVVDYAKREVQLSWQSIEDAAEYKVLRHTDSEWKTAENTAAAQTTIKISAYGEKQKYMLHALDKDGNLIGKSEPFILNLPAKADGLQTTAYSGTKVKLCWSKAPGANEYQIKMKKAGGTYQQAAAVKGTNITLTVAKGSQYTFRVIPVYRNDRIVLKGSASSITFQNTEIVSADHQHYSYTEMCSDIKALKKKYSACISYESIGKSVQGREIYDVVLGNPDAEKALLVVSTLHAREYVSTVVCMEQLEYYLSNYNHTIDGKKPADLFDKCCVHYIMMANPDGVVISQSRNPTWKGNANGVNLNRNFPYAFHVQGSIKANDYSGRKAASESETKAIIRITKQLAKKKQLAVVNYHAMGNIVFGGYSGKNSSLRSRIEQMYRTARNTTGYADARSYGGSSNGNYREYLNYSLCVPSITIEVGSVSCPVPYRYYPSIFQQNRLVILREAAILCSW